MELYLKMNKKDKKWTEWDFFTCVDWRIVKINKGHIVCECVLVFRFLNVFNKNVYNSKLYQHASTYTHCYRLLIHLHIHSQNAGKNWACVAVAVAVITASVASFTFSHVFSLAIFQLWTFVKNEHFCFDSLHIHITYGTHLHICI